MKRFSNKFLFLLFPIVLIAYLVIASACSSLVTSASIHVPGVSVRHSTYTIATTSNKRCKYCN
jgi:hypothetical protein